MIYPNTDDKNDFWDYCHLSLSEADPTSVHLKLKINVKIESYKCANQLRALINSLQ